MIPVLESYGPYEEVVSTFCSPDGTLFGEIVKDTWNGESYVNYYYADGPEKYPNQNDASRAGSYKTYEEAESYLHKHRGTLEPCDMTFSDWAWKLGDSKTNIPSEVFGKWRVEITDWNGKPVAKFYDMSADKDKFPGGQFTGASYYIDTLLGKDDFGSSSIADKQILKLDAGVPSWTVKHDDLVDIAAWLEQFE